MKKILFVLVALLPALQGAKAADTDIQAKGRAIWCEGNKTLYFAISDIKAGDDYNSQKVTKVYNVCDFDYAQIPDLEWQNESERGVRESVEKVVFIDNFIDFKPVKCKGWFYEFKNLKEVVDLKNLNTSNVTNMDFMFCLCESLTTIDVNDIDLKNVTAAESMFAQCYELTTIYCNNEWKVQEGITGAGMFADCDKLKGGVAYDDDKKTIEMATPKDGYFTARIETKNGLAELEGWYGDVTLDGLSLKKDNNWHTVCLPFSVTVSGSIFDGAVIREFNPETTLSEMGDTDEQQAQGGTLSLKFFVANEITAGIPYLIKWESSGDAISSPTFKGVTIEAIEPKNVSNSTNTVTFEGHFSSFTINDENKDDYLCMNDDNTVGYCDNTTTLNEFGAHFEVQKSDDGQRAVTDIEYNFDSDPTAIAGIVDERQEDGAWYTLGGMKQSGQPTSAGVFIKNGRKIIIR